MPSTERSTRFVAVAAIVLAGSSIAMQVRDRIGTRSINTERLSLQDANHATRAQLHLAGQDPTLTAFMPDGSIVQMTLKQSGSTLSVDVSVDGKQLKTIALSPEAP